LLIASVATLGGVAIVVAQRASKATQLKATRSSRA
jgi:hypothetical protein